VTVQDAQGFDARRTITRAPVSKRGLDILASVLGLILLLPAFLVIGLAIRIDSAGPILFRQLRVGRHGRHFWMYKFRSMAAGQSHFRAPITLDKDPRVTRVGAFLRASKIDELPQLLNVLIGDMSLVGPRPEVPELFAYYSPAQQMAFLAIRPGMTDYASLLLRNESSFLSRAEDYLSIYRQRLMPIKYQLCERYLREMSFQADIRIVCATLFSLISHRKPEWFIDERIVRYTADMTAKGPY
jgi:lipopolysaccharide/colanic/teichoic acid biosynthesis glycosyltransferase